MGVRIYIMILRFRLRTVPAVFLHRQMLARLFAFHAKWSGSYFTDILVFSQFRTFYCRNIEQNIMFIPNFVGV